MNRHERFALLSREATADREHGLPGRPRLQEGPVGIRPLRMPGGGVTRLMRVMQTNACSLSCGYCPTFCGGKVRRVSLGPEEAARTFMEANRAGAADGLFLTSGVPGRPRRAMDRVLATAEVLRRREGFSGYLHLKMLPGADDDQVRAAVRLASRVSINLEGPTDDVVRRLASDKNLSGDLLPKLELAGRLSREARLEGRPSLAAPAGTTTQFVVGAQGEADRDLLGLVGRLEATGLLHHAHWSAFQPVAGTPMEGLPAVPAMREARLYQAEHLLRQYGFSVDELDSVPRLFARSQPIDVRIGRRRVQPHSIELDRVIGVERAIFLAGDEHRLFASIDKQLQSPRIKLLVESGANHLVSRHSIPALAPHAKFHGCSRGDRGLKQQA